MTQEEMLKNYLGLSYEKQVEVYNLFYKTLCDNKEGETARVFYYNFYGFLQYKKDVFKAYEDFTELNSSQTRFIRYYLFNDAIQSLSDANKKKSLTTEVKIKEASRKHGVETIKQYYDPKLISDERVDNYIKQFSQLDTLEQVKFALEFVEAYSNFKEFNDYWELSYSKNLVSKGNNMMHFLLGDLSPKYDELDNGIKFYLIDRVIGYVHTVIISTKRNEDLSVPLVRKVKPLAENVLEKA